MTGAEIGALVLGAVGAASGVAALIQDHRRGRQSDSIQERLASIEEARRRDEQRPELTMRAASDNQLVAITIRNGHRCHLDHVEIVDVVEAPPIIARGIKSVVMPYYSLKMGEPMSLSVDADVAQPGGHLVLMLRVKTEHGTMELPVECEVARPIIPLARWG